MDRGDIRGFARSITDLDALDISDALLNMYIKDGYDRVIAMERSWPFFEDSATLNAVANTQTYALSGINSGQFREISSLLDTGRNLRLQYISHDEAEGSNRGFTITTRPLYFSFWEQSLYLWPRPSENVTYTVRGYRVPTNWTANDTTECDMDERLHQSLVYYAASKMYEYQEDPDMAAVYEKQFRESVAMARDDIMRIPVNSPMMLSVGKRYN
jgi:hypothetical protein